MPPITSKGWELNVYYMIILHIVLSRWITISRQSPQRQNTFNLWPFEIHYSYSDTRSLLLDVKQLVVVGMVTNECVESAVRDASDKGFLITVVEEGCAAASESNHLNGLKNMRGFSRIKRVDDVIKEVESSSGSELNG